MILVDTGPLVALFDPGDPDHVACRATGKRLTEELVTTIPVLTETSHLLGPARSGLQEIGGLVSAGNLMVEFLSPELLDRMFRLMEQYRDHDMDLADASLVAAAEAHGTRRVWTLDRNDFATYRVRRGHRFEPFEIVS